MKAGGEVVNYELAGLIYDMYKLHQKLNITLEWMQQQESKSDNITKYLRFEILINYWKYTLLWMHVNIKRRREKKKT